MLWGNALRRADMPAGARRSDSGMAAVKIDRFGIEAKGAGGVAWCIWRASVADSRSEAISLGSVERMLQLTVALAGRICGFRRHNAEPPNTRNVINSLNFVPSVATDSARETGDPGRADGRSVSCMTGCGIAHRPFVPCATTAFQRCHGREGFPVPPANRRLHMNTLDAQEAVAHTPATHPCARARFVAAAAAEHATEVDRDARFPHETFAAARQHRLLSMLVPVDLGGDGATVSDAVDVCYMLGMNCGSSAMIFAMHQIQVVILLRHAQTSPWHQRLLRRLCDDQLLFASSTTENQTGGQVRTSACAVERDASGRMSLVKNGTVMSYGAQADGIFLTARRTADAQSSDQVLVTFLKSDYELEKIKEWDTMGMRGTCSTGFTLRGGGAAEQVVPESYERIHPQSMVPIAHLTWSAVWCGIAAGAVGRARRLVRKGAAQGSNGQAVPGAAHLTRAMMSLRALRGSISAAAASYESAASDGNRLE